jgi:hypothetical protein
LYVVTLTNIQLNDNASWTRARVAASTAKKYIGFSNCDTLLHEHCNNLNLTFPQGVTIIGVYIDATHNSHNINQLESVCGGKGFVRLCLLLFMATAHHDTIDVASLTCARVFRISQYL